MRVFVVVFAVVLLAGCGGGDKPVRVGSASAALRDAGWQVHAARGMPQTVSGVPQTGFLELVSPDGVAVDVQLLPDADAAVKELAAAEKGLPGFTGARILNTLAFSHPNGRTAVSEKTLSALRSILA